MENIKENIKKSSKHTKIRLNKLFLPRGKGINNYKILSSQKKIENEISAMTKENRNEFREALNKYTFDTEVFIPRSMSINKNEYKNKNYLLNTLVLFETKTQERKKLVEPLKLETNRFSKQYKLIREENEEHQKAYLRGLENYYHDRGYNVNSIEYHNTDNIFKPSSVLDHDFGMNLQEDAYKYSDIDFQKDYTIDQKLLKKWQKGIQDAKEKKSRTSKKLDEEDEIMGYEKKEKTREKEREREMRSMTFRKELEKVKNSLMEENKIKNMSREQYFYYNRQIKNDIQNTKKLLEQFDENKNNSYFNQNNLTMNYFDKNRVSKTYKIIHPTQNKNYKEKIIFSTLNLKDSVKKIKKDKNKKFQKNYLSPSPKHQITEKIKNNAISLTENNIFLSSDKNVIKNDKRDSLPQILLDQDKSNKKDYSESKKNNNNIDKDEIKSEKSLRKKQKENELDNLYNLVYNNKNNFFDRYPSKSVEKYFKKYTKKKIPVLNFRKGSNIHGLLEEFQYIAQKKDFYKIAESSNDVKNDLNYSRGLSRTKNDNEDKALDNIDKLQEMDEKIPELHYLLAENLLINKAKKKNKKNKY